MESDVYSMALAFWETRYRTTAYHDVCIPFFFGEFLVNHSHFQTFRLEILQINSKWKSVEEQDQTLGLMMNLMRSWRFVSQHQNTKYSLRTTLKNKQNNITTTYQKKPEMLVLVSIRTPYRPTSILFHSISVRFCCSFTLCTPPPYFNNHFTQ